MKIPCLILSVLYHTSLGDNLPFVFLSSFHLYHLRHFSIIRGMSPIFFLKSPSSAGASDKQLIGARDITAKLRWSIRDFNLLSADLPQLVNFWKPSGIIIECGEWKRPIDLQPFGKTPVVFIDHDPTTLAKGCFNILQNSISTGEAAARELMLTDYCNFAYVPFAGKWWWNDERERGFENAMALNGFTVRKFTTRQTDLHSQNYMRDLRKFLTTLPKPCAVFAANDREAELVLFVAKSLGLSIPNDLAIVGVDDFEPICEHTVPKLSSIRPDLYRAGELSVLMLAAILRDGAHYRGSHVRHYNAEWVVRRESSCVFKNPPDKDTQNALDLIHKDACNGLKAETVIQNYSCSRSPAARRFRAATGHSIQEEIHAVQMARAKTLLADPGQQIKAIATFCGFTNPNSLGKLFLRETGMTMTEWRHQHLSSASDFGSRLKG